MVTNKKLSMDGENYLRWQAQRSKNGQSEAGCVVNGPPPHTLKNLGLWAKAHTACHAGCKLGALGLQKKIKSSFENIKPEPDC